ncbi:uncharacterized protein LOC118190472 [Stegodyphus dumicola]|uniref:uncharacterized protein LOC118190472 n=1 Tax=Stegodyphus dumicola TaxID=202533 RepID=UPI0015A981A9|nr:uncharacterized protein LOC118190472 [Stegodyphus dumicola]
MVTNGEASSIFKDFWAWRLKDSPEFATLIGVHLHDGCLQEYSLDSFAKRKKKCKMFLEEAIQYASHVKEDNELKENLQLFIDELSNYIKGLDAKGYVFPINYLEGVQLEFVRLIELMKFENERDYRNLFARYGGLAGQFLDMIQVMQEGMRTGMTYHPVSMEGVIDQMKRLQEDAPENSIFYKPLLSMPDTISEQRKDELRKEALPLIQHGVQGMFGELQFFLEYEYFSCLRPNVGISSIPNGKEYYQMCLEFHLGFHMTPEEVHEMGLREVARISADIERVIESMELCMPVKEFYEHMRQDESFYFNDAAELVDAYHGIVFNQIKPKLDKIIKTMPQCELVIKPTPPSMASGPAAYYLAGTLDGSQPGVFYVNVRDVKATPKYEMMTLALHEALPGHHLQASYMMEQRGLPDFRRYIEDRKYGEAPSRFPLHSAYVEGWGLYCEYLGYELGLYEDSYFHFGHLSHEMLRACRLVVDTGLHALNI